jgi:hypothetical protein
MTAVGAPVRAAAHPAGARPWLQRLHVLLAVQSLLLVLASINRL